MALYPAAMQYATRWIWETSLTTFLFAAALALAIKMRGIEPRDCRVIADPPNRPQPQTTEQWLLFGLLGPNSALQLYAAPIYAGLRNLAPAPLNR